MATTHHPTANIWLTKLFSVAGNLAEFIGGIAQYVKKEPGNTAVKEAVPEPVKQVSPPTPVATNPSPVIPTAPPASAKVPAQAEDKPGLILLSTVKPAALIAAKGTEVKPPVQEKPEPEEKRPGAIRIVRRANLIAFEGFELEIHTGKYRGALDYFDTYYFNYLGESVTEIGTQVYKFKVKDRETEKAEIRFKLTDSRFSRLIYQVMIVEAFEHFLPGNSPLDEEIDEEEGEEQQGG